MLIDNSFVCNLRAAENCYNNCQTQFFARLLALLARRPCFYLVIGLVDLTIGLAIGDVVLMAGKVAVGLFG